jgi:hypothetical protein
MPRNSVTGERSQTGGGQDQSTTAGVNITGDTINTGVDIARSAPAAAITGVILAPGTWPGQRVVVCNEGLAASTITFAAAATSNVADGVTSVIPGLRASEFIWDSGVSRWFRTA